MNRAKSSRLFLCCLVLLAATDGFVLYRVHVNRSGPHDARLSLTERELVLPGYQSKEDSGLALRIDWRTLPAQPAGLDYYQDGSPGWLDRQLLHELGFTFDLPAVSAEPPDSSKDPLPREAFIVLELDGPDYRETVARTEAMVRKKAERLAKGDPEDKQLRADLERAEQQLKYERIAASRLFAVAAGLDPAVLRTKYPDRQRFIITAALIRARYERSGGKVEVVGSIERLSIGWLHVPLEFRQPFDHLPPRGDSAPPPRYLVDIAYGAKWEPWVIGARSFKAEP